MRRDERGQASVELIAIVPLFIMVALVIGQVIAAGTAREAAAHAAQTGAMAMMQEGDPKDAAAAAIPQWSPHRVRVVVHGRTVRVRVQPKFSLPGLRSRVTADESATAGPAS